MKHKPKERNPLHDHPLMAKGGVHEKSKKAKRRTEKQQLKKEWCYSIAFLECSSITLFSTGSLIVKAPDCRSGK